MILEKIHCVQFYLYEQITVELKQISGIFGPNGAGKSSFIDAVQIAMFGGNQNLVALNAQADDKMKSTRTIRGYCLGQYDAQPHQRVRENSTSYITLVWRDPKTNHSVSTGLCIAAYGDQDNHEVLGRYVADGIELTLSDHISLENGNECPRNWRAFRADLARRVEQYNGRPEEVFYDNSDRYMKAFLTLMSHGKDAGSISLFKRAFRFGLRMRFEKSVDAIVREEVLEARPTHVKAFKEITETFRNLRALVESVEKKIEDGEEIIKHFSEADKLEKRATAWSVLDAKVAAEKAQDEASTANSDANTAHEDWENAITQRKLLNDQIFELESEESRLTFQRDSHKAHDRLSMLTVAINRDKNSASLHAKEAQKKVDDLRKILENVSKAHELNEQHLALNTTISSLHGLKIGSVSSFEVEIEEAVAQAKKAWESIFLQHKILDRALEEKINERDNIEKNLERNKSGKASLPSNVTQLMRHLSNHGIEATPVCDLVRISDSSWQPAIESFLGETNLVALLVDESNESDAFRLYRQLDAKDAIFGIKLLMPSRIQKKQTSHDSVAELIIGENELAIAFLRNIFGDIRCAETNEDALSGGRALTRDGMYVGRDTFERRRLVRIDELRLGAQSASHTTNLSTSLSVVKDAITRIEGDLARITSLLTILGTVPESQALIDSIRTELDWVGKYQKDISSSEISMHELGGEEYQSLCDRVAHIVTQIKNIRDDHTNAVRLEGITAASFNAKRDLADQKASKARIIRADAEIKYNETVFDTEYAESRWNEIYQTYKRNWYEMQKCCVDQHKNRIQEMNTAINKGIRTLQDFVQKHRETPSTNVLDDWHQAYPWVRNIVEQLKLTELMTYREQMLRAEKASQDTFRTDVALTLHNNLVWLDQQMKRLNSVLSRSPAFSNGERYEFKRTVRKDYEELLRFVENVATYGSEDDLFGGPGEVPAQFLALLDETTAPGSAGARSPIEDYREFFEFDVNILREDATTGRQKIVSQLSKRIGHGSGGEHRAPLYVIAGAALASAYDVDDTHDDGMRLILLDEAFNKMDPQNIIATMRYLESLGLQIFLASPGENLATLTAFMHRYYQILRDAEHNVVILEGYDISSEIRQVMRSDLPEFHPELVDQAMSDTKMVI